MLVVLSTLVERVVEFMVVVPSRTVVEVVLVLVVISTLLVLVVTSIPVVPVSASVVSSCAFASEMVVRVNPTIATDETRHAAINK